jgi:hypothetical protein
MKNPGSRTLYHFSKLSDSLVNALTRQQAGLNGSSQPFDSCHPWRRDQNAGQILFLLCLRFRGDLLGALKRAGMTAWCGPSPSIQTGKGKLPLNFWSLGRVTKLPDVSLDCLRMHFHLLTLHLLTCLGLLRGQQFPRRISGVFKKRSFRAFNQQCKAGLRLKEKDRNADRTYRNGQNCKVLTREGQEAQSE